MRERLGVRTLAIAAGVLFVLSVIGLVTIDDDGGTTVVTAAVEATARTGTAAYSLEQKVSIGGNTNALTATGHLDFGAERATVVMTPPAPQPRTDAVIDGTRTYVKATAAPYNALAQGKSWVVLPGRTALTASIAGTGDPLSTLQAMRRKGVLRSVVEEGSDEVRGVRTIRYAAEFDPERAFGGGGLRNLGAVEARMTVWISDDGLLRRQRVTTTVRASTGTVGPVTAEVTLELFEFGTPVRIDVPPADQVHELRAQAGS